jgi:hypothetical protein
MTASALAPRRPGRPCTICKLPNRRAIDIAIVSRRGSLRAIALQFKLGDKTPVTRHARRCIPIALARAAQNREAAEGASLEVIAMQALQRALDLEGIAANEFYVHALAGSEARQAALNTWIKASQATRGVAALLRPAANVNVNVLVSSPEWLQHKAHLVSFLARRGLLEEYEAEGAANRAMPALGGGDGHQATNR